jgi:hypothetical protein
VNARGSARGVADRGRPRAPRRASSREHRVRVLCPTASDAYSKGQYWLRLDANTYHCAGSSRPLPLPPP